jgi:rhodanese-related sulfurtransferase
MKTEIIDGIPEIHPQELKAFTKKLKLIDVRRPDEFTGELGHIDGAKLVTLGPDLAKFLDSADKNSEIVFVCRSGGRSGQATQVSRGQGFTKTYNMTGGMLLWNKLQLPTKK